MVRVFGLASAAAALGVSSAVSTEQRQLSSLPVYAVPAFDYATLTDGSSPQRLLEVLQTDGILALKNVPNYANLREDFLRRAAECALTGHEDPNASAPHVSKKSFDDGTQRYTISTNAGQELANEEGATYRDCPGYKERYLALSRAMEHAVNTFGVALDKTAFTASDGQKTISSRKLVSEAVRLDHFHAYEAAPASATDNNSRHRQLELELSLPLHEDHGMFIAMSAPKYFEVDASGRRLEERELAADASGLVIQTGNGQRVRPVLNPDEVVIMMGTGATRWLQTSHALRPVLHGMKMPEAMVSSSEAGRRSLRAWFGKMTLLPAYQRMLLADGASFEQHVNATTRYLMTSEEADLKSIGCATGRHLAASEGKCTFRTCTPKAGAAAPGEPCSVICNREGHGPGDAAECAEKCSCGPANSGERCWMLCVAALPSDKCASADQTCSGQQLICTNPVTPVPPTPTTTAPPAPTTTAPAPPAPTMTAPAPPSPTTSAPPSPTTTAPTPTTTTPGTTTPAPGPTTPAPVPTDDRAAC